MKLFIIYIGGAHEQSRIELHDMRFVVANCIEETFEALRQSWWGIPSSLHLDAWGELHYADGHCIQISTEPKVKQDKKLYFVNLGGYSQKQFTELHNNVFVIATDAVGAKKKALEQISDWESPHRDYLYEIDSILDLSQLLAANNHYLHFQEETESRPFEFICRYTPIGKPVNG